MTAVRPATRAVLFVVLALGAALFLAPLGIMVAMSLKTPAEIAKTAPWAWPKALTWDAYRTVLTDTHLGFARKFANTLFISVASTLGVTLTSALTAYPFARLAFTGRDRLFTLLLATMMLPGVATMIPGYVLYARLGWVDTYLPFVVPALLGGGAFNVFLVRQFMLGLSREMDEAALLDGAGALRIFWSIVLPNCGPVLATVAVFCFVASFRDFLGPLMMISDPDKQTLEVGLRGLQTAHGTDWNLLMAGSVLVMLPIVAIFVFCQRYFVRGIALTGGK